MSQIGTPDTASTPSPNRRIFQRSETSWTDDIPECKLSDIGVATNVMYLADGRVTEAYAFEDHAFNFALDHDCYLYGVFDGHDGTRAAHFAAQRLPAELLLGQLTPHVNENSMKKILQQAFSVVERGFFESIDTQLAQKTHLQSQLPERLPPDIAEKHYPSLVQQIKILNDAIKGGTTAVVALIVNNDLYVANVGDSRALLCQKNQRGQLEVNQITVNHDINNEQELGRLSHLGLNVEKILERGKLGMNECTRCIGDYTVKGGYREKEMLKNATSEPVIATPDVFGGIHLNDVKDGFLVLMSDDVYKSLEQGTGTKHANEDIAAMISHELLCKNSITGVAQNIIDKIAYLHRKGYGKTPFFSRGDITLIVRNINHPVGTNALPDLTPPLSDMSGRHPVSVPYNKRNSSEFMPADQFPVLGKPPVTLSLVIPHQHNSNEGIPGLATGLVEGRSSDPASDDTPTNMLSEKSCKSPAIVLNADESLYYSDNHESMQLDADNKVAPYISFATFNDEAWEQLQARKKGALLKG